MSSRKQLLIEYALAVAAVAAATLVRLSLDPWLGDRPIVALYFAAVAVAIWIGGLGPATAASVLGYLLSHLLFVEPRGQLTLADWEDFFGIVVYLSSCAVIIALGEVLRRARTKAKYEHDSLELALKAANMNTFDIDLNGKEAWRSENAANFYGLVSMDRSREAFLGNLHPDDRKKHLDAIEESRASGKEFSSRYRFIRPLDKRLMRVEARGRVIRDKAGRARMIGAAVDVTRRVSLEQQLAEHARALAEANQRKSQFIATLAHELRNPLAPIKNCIALMGDSRTDERSRKSALQIMKRQTEAIERLVEDLLEVSRIEQGKITLRPGRVDMAGIIQKATELSMPHVEAKSQHLSVQLPGEPLFVNADEGRMIQVLSNLLNNGSKFTAAGGSISITGSKDTGAAVISVKDDGAGIAPQDLKSVFEVFFQAGGAANQANPGLGLGLSLSRGLVELHGGTLEAKSEGPGKGSEFIVRLPLAEPDQPSARP